MVAEVGAECLYVAYYMTFGDLLFLMELTAV